MPSTPEAMSQKLDALKTDIVGQGRAVQSMTEQAFAACFGKDAALAQRVIASDSEIDRVDVAVEQTAVALLTIACTEGAAMTPQQVRTVLTIVKVNNELERIADVASLIAEQTTLLNDADGFPPAFRVLANSTVAILRDSVSSLASGDPTGAKRVLMSQATVARFKQELVTDVQQQLARQTLSLRLAPILLDMANACVVMTDHCTNICEQVLYLATGKIVRHFEGKWEEVDVPALPPVTGAPTGTI